ncbi:MAG TPA: tRNA 4-thiouridine(8) synthase ThiI [Thermodesulfobacteriota bacterium]|nr:tRNA 4-thiouridine(8) synthase ThiI [Thermodesulfobacteriota bacterium]
MKRSITAVGLLSGGLDSILAARTILEQGIKVHGVSFVTPFFGAEKARKASDQLKIPLTVLDITEDHWAMMKQPRYGFGKGMNPCIDCHILMVKKAGEWMLENGADFLFTGEVLGQRPFSQTKPSLRAVEKGAGFLNRLLRPLSALLLPETMTEQEGLVDRSRLLDISGRSRKIQMALAEKYGILDYPAPAGGCLLTDPIFSLRLKELLAHRPSPEMREVELLKTGRHFRISSEIKIIIGRNKRENEFIEKWSLPEDPTARVMGCPGPMAVALGEMQGEADWAKLAQLCLVYSDAPAGQLIPVQLGQGERRWIIKFMKAAKEDFRDWMIA